MLHLRGLECVDNLVDKLLTADQFVTTEQIRSITQQITSPQPHTFTSRGCICGYYRSVVFPKPSFSSSASSLASNGIPHAARTAR